MAGTHVVSWRNDEMERGLWVMILSFSFKREFGCAIRVFFSISIQHDSIERTAQNISTRTGHHKVKHLMGIMNRPLVTTSVSIIWHHIVINNTWAGFNGKMWGVKSEHRKKQRFSQFSFSPRRRVFLLKFYNRCAEGSRELSPLAQLQAASIFQSIIQC